MLAFAKSRSYRPLVSSKDPDAVPCNCLWRVFNLEHLVNANVWFIPIHRDETIAREGARSRDRKPLIHVDYFYEMFAVSRNEHTDVSYR